MNDRKYRVLLVAAHPTQYSAPVFRTMAQHPNLEIQLAYCSLQGATPGYDPGFNRGIAWDVPLLDGYSWVELPNRSMRPGVERFFGLVNPGLWKLIRGGAFDAVVLYIGYKVATFWIGIAAAKANGAAVLFGTDQNELASRDGRAWKTTVKRWLWPCLFRLADVVTVSSSGGAALMKSLGIPEQRLALTPLVVDNSRWTEAAMQANRATARARWGIPPDAPVVVFSAKLQPWKRPLDLLHAFIRAKVPGSYVLFAGEGPLRSRLEEEIARLGAAGNSKLLGFVNQSALPEVYRAGDVLVLPSDFEPFGLVVNEAMLCGCVPVVTDRVGARFDLVEDGVTGFVYPAGDVEKLSEVLRGLLANRHRLRQMSEQARQRIQKWSPQRNVEAFFDAVSRAEALKR